MKGGAARRSIEQVDSHLREKVRIAARQNLGVLFYKRKSDKEKER